MKSQRLIIGLLVITALLAFTAFADDPPSLTDFQQFHGKVNNLPAGDFILVAYIGVNDVADQAVSGEGTYGQNPTFKVFANEGDTITFYVENSTGEDVEVGTHIYQNKHVTELNFDYPNQPDQPGDQGEPDDVVEEDNQTEEGDPPTTRRRRRGRSGRTKKSDRPPPLPSSGSCLQSWHCTMFSTCSSGTQRRTCTQVDNCDVLVASGQAKNITHTPKPTEQRSCETESTASQGNVNIICPARTKRCLGDELQICTGDGGSWESLQECQNSCDPFSLTCEGEAPVEVLETQKPSSTWPFFLGGSLLFVAIIIVLVLFIYNEKKFGPAKEYIKNTRAKGFPDSQIRKKLTSEGWDSGKIDKMMR